MEQSEEDMTEIKPNSQSDSESTVNSLSIFPSQKYSTEKSLDNCKGNLTSSSSIKEIYADGNLMHNNKLLGKWTAEEKELFLESLKIHGKDWVKIAACIKTRTLVQVRTHAQKYFLLLERRHKRALRQLEQPFGTSKNKRLKTDTRPAVLITNLSCAAVSFKNTDQDGKVLVDRYYNQNCYNPLPNGMKEESILITNLPAAALSFKNSYQNGKVLMDSCYNQISYNSTPAVIASNIDSVNIEPRWDNGSAQLGLKWDLGSNSPVTIVNNNLEMRQSSVHNNNFMPLFEMQPQQHPHIVHSHTHSCRGGSHCQEGVRLSENCEVCQYSEEQTTEAIDFLEECFGNESDMQNADELEMVAESFSGLDQVGVQRTISATEFTDVLDDILDLDSFWDA